MSTHYPVEVNQQSDQPSLSPSNRVDERIARVENGLVRMSANGQPQMARQILSPQIEMLNNPLSDAFGLGVELQRTSQGPKAWHTGGTWGSNSVIWFYPQIGTGAVVMTNSASGSMLRFEILLSVALTYGWPMS